MDALWTEWHDQHANKIELIAGIDCWIWSGGRGGRGYGRVKYAGQPEFAPAGPMSDASCCSINSCNRLVFSASDSVNMLESLNDS